MISLFIFILIASFYTSWNIGANDVANAVGPGVGSGSITLRQAVLIAAVFEVLGALLLGSRVAGAIESEIITVPYGLNHSTEYIYGMASILLATGLWLQLASFFGWPVSTTHSIVGSVIGLGWVFSKGTIIHWGFVGTIVLSWCISPILGGCIAYLVFSLIRRNIFYKSNPVEAMVRAAPFLTAIMVFSLGSVIIFGGVMRDLISNHYLVSGMIVATCLAYMITRHYVRRDKCLTIPEHPVEGSLTHRLKMIGGDYGTKYLIVERIFAYLQIIVACFMAFSHGSNDVANAIAPVMGAIRIVFPQWHASYVSTLLMAFGGLGLVIGLATWGWRVIETIGNKITELTPSRAFSVGFSAALTIALASAIGLPVSTTHVLVGAVLGIGMARGIRAINLNIIKDIIMSWFITVPIGAVLSIMFFYILRTLFYK